LDLSSASCSLTVLHHDHRQHLRSASSRCRDHARERRRFGAFCAVVIATTKPSRKQAATSAEAQSQRLGEPLFKRVLELCTTKV